MPFLSAVEVVAGSATQPRSQDPFPDFYYDYY
jgi:hypothetical protein